MGYFQSSPKVTADDADYDLSQIVNNGNDSLNRHWSTVFVSIKLEIPPVTLIIRTPDPHVSLEGDAEC